MQAALKALNDLVASGVIETYAIGGAVGAAFYIQAMQTEDVDAFIMIDASSSSILVSLSPIYKALQRLGGVIDREYVRFGDWPLEVLTDATPLLAEAIRDAVAVEFEGVNTRVFTAEHLARLHSIQVARRTMRGLRCFWNRGRG